MHLSQAWRGGLAFAVLATLALAVRADDSPNNPLRLIPDQADVLIQADSPRALVEAVTTLDLFHQFQELEAIRELYDSTNYRRFLKLVAHFEKELGLAWPEMLDKLGGGGAALAVKVGQNPAPALLVLQGTDEALTKKFTDMGLELIAQELARQEVKETIEKQTYRGIETVHVGENFHAARAGSAILISNKAAVLKPALDRFLDGGSKSMAQVKTVAEARKLLPKQGLLASLWLNLETVKKAPQADDAFRLPRNNAPLTVLFGGWLDVASRSSFAAAGLVKTNNGFMLTARLPAGRDGMAEGMSVHIPPADAVPPPPLKPKGVLLSDTFYLDLAKFWTERAKLFNAEQVKAFEDADKNTGRFLAGNRISDLFTKVGMYHRIVVAAQPKAGYKVQPGQPIPAFAFVADARDPEGLGKAMEAILRAAALLTGTQFRLKLVEEEVDGVKLIGFRFPEDGTLANDTQNLRFNFSPCFARVNDEWMACSTMELGRELVGLLKKEKRATALKSKAVPSQQTQVLASGGVQLLNSIRDQLLAQTVLDRALTPAEAEKQVKLLLDLVRKLGVLRVESTYTDKEFHYDIRLQLAGNAAKAR